MKYILSKHILNERKEIEITKAKYLELINSQSILTHARAIEETYDLIINNYLEFEIKLFEFSMDDIVHFNRDYFNFYKTRSALNSKLISLLTSVTLYRDTLKQHVKICLPNQHDIKEKIDKLFETQRENIDFLFMEKLRNHIQHFGMPVHNVTHQINVTSLDEDRMIEYSIELESLSNRFFADKEMRKAFENKIEEKVDLRKFTRIYVETIGDIQIQIRELIEENVNKNRKIIESAHKQYSADETESFAGLRARKIENNKEVDSIPLLLEWDDVRIELITRNNNLNNLQKCYVTGAIHNTNKK